MRRTGTIAVTLVLLAAAAGLSTSLEAAPRPGLLDVKSSLAGVVLADDLVEVGARVEDAQPLVYVRLPLTGRKDVAATARGDGIIREVLVEVGQRIEPGDVVVRMEPR